MAEVPHPANATADPALAGSILEFRPYRAVTSYGQHRIRDVGEGIDRKVQSVPGPQRSREADHGGLQGKPEAETGVPLRRKQAEEARIDPVGHDVDPSADATFDRCCQLVADRDHAVCAMEHGLLAASSKPSHAESSPRGVLLGEEGVHLDRVGHAQANGEAAAGDAEKGEALIDHVGSERLQVVEGTRWETRDEAQFANLATQSLRPARMCEEEVIAALRHPGACNADEGHIVPDSLECGGDSGEVQ
jgi:hypothetical protein